MSATHPLIGEQITYRLELPFPVSANRLWRSSTGWRGTRVGVGVHLSPEYRSWIKEADGLYLSHKRKIGPVQTLGAYRLACVFSRDKRSPLADGDNLCKCVHDWLQRVEVIKNDCLCEGGSWVWGEASAGTSVVITGYPWAGET